MTGGGSAGRRARAASPYLLAALLLGAGTTHFARPAPYDAIVPGFLPAHRAFTYASGVVELLVGAALMPRRTRRPAATAAAVLFVVVFPANVEMAVHPGGVPRWLALARLPVQVPLVVWALQVGRSAAVRAPSR